MKIKFIKLDVGGMHSEIVNFDKEVIIDESEVGFEIDDKEMEGGGDECCTFWMIREDSECYNMSGEEFVEKEMDCELSKKNGYSFELDRFGDEVNELSKKYFDYEVEWYRE